ncbi:hypothetical protein I302_107065 [Kwoniella bestiolae CBS 10118]|uniref:Uncharacterized protein n=1 Tax=Kwoniella bestiolae CBS 10118 TaxID=1296100 RepID=A0A1B9FZM4_9TREE|nr:hypothetical protein I302_05670 [Kwoniella bestiolae CBS 10118]OCF24211.1 hypothetical protein I302_05670 [Kwoniella bestiolae CBS 10118]
MPGHTTSRPFITQQSMFPRSSQCTKYSNSYNEGGYDYSSSNHHLLTSDETITKVPPIPSSSGGCQSGSAAAERHNLLPDSPFYRNQKVNVQNDGLFQRSDKEIVTNQQDYYRGDADRRADLENNHQNFMAMLSARPIPYTTRASQAGTEAEESQPIRPERTYTAPAASGFDTHQYSIEDDTQIQDESDSELDREFPTPDKAATMRVKGSQRSTVNTPDVRGSKGKGKRRFYRLNLG